MEEQLIFLLDNLATHKFGMIKEGDLQGIDNIYNMLYEQAKKENVLLQFGGNPHPAEKFYLKYLDNIFVFAKIKSSPPYYWFEKVEGQVIWPMLEFNK